MAGVNSVGGGGQDAMQLYKSGMQQGDKGAIDGKEIDGLAKSMGMSKEEFLKKYDKNGDGKIDGDELKKLYQDLLKHMQGQDSTEKPQESPGGGGQKQKTQPKTNNEGPAKPDFYSTAGADKLVDKQEAQGAGINEETFNKNAGEDGKLNEQEFNQAVSK